MAKLSLERRWHVVHLRSVHRSPASIAKKVKCSKKTVYFWLAQLEKSMATRQARAPKSLKFSFIGGLTRAYTRSVLPAQPPG